MKVAIRVVVFLCGGIVLAVIASALLAGLSENAGWLPTSRLVHRFGVQQSQGKWWSIETMGNAYVDEVIALPFIDEATAQAHLDLSRKSMAAVLKSDATSSSHAMDDAFTLPAWQDATAQPVAANVRADAKGLAYATNRGFGFPVRYGHWRTIPNGAAPGTLAEGAFRLGPLPIATIAHWPGLLVDALCWGAITGGAWTGATWLARRIRRPRAAKNGPA